MYDAQILGELARIKGLLGTLLTKTNALSEGKSYPEIDFAVDNFDRADASTLGPYWQATAGYSVLNGKAVLTGNLAEISPAFAFGQSVTGVGGVYYNGSNNNTYYSTEIGLGITVTHNNDNSDTKTLTDSYRLMPSLSGVESFESRSKNLYAGKFTQIDLNLKITFEVPIQPPLSTTDLGNIGDNLYTNTPVIKNHAAYRHNVLSLSSGGVFANSEKNILRTCIAGFDLSKFRALGASSTNLNLVSKPIPDDSRNLILARLTFGDEDTFEDTFGSPVTLYTVISRTNISNQINFLKTVKTFKDSENFSEGFIVPGINTLFMNVVGNVYTATLNEKEIYTKTSNALAERTFAGLYALSMNTVLAAEKAGAGYYGITQFKAWRADQPEPADSESGHGIYDADNNIVWKDKYHTFDSETGEYIYNPLVS